MSDDLPDKPRLLAGAMSGTSADGVDVALVEITGHGLNITAALRHHHAHPYDVKLKQALFAARGAGRIALAELAQLGRDISLAYAAAINAALAEGGWKATDLTAIAAHGQTLFHEPPNTIQWLDPALLAAEVGCQIVSDFRRADCAAGGQGAPLVPFADWILFRHASKKRVLLNIGGIANLTYLHPGWDQSASIAFDTGPGNCISDALFRKWEPGGPGFDPGGATAASGTPCEELVAAFLADPYFSRPPPKSTDGPAMIGIFQRALGRSMHLEDKLASACVATVRSIDLAMKRFLPDLPDELIVSGGGTLNQAMMYHLRKLNTAVLTTDELGVPSAAKEAIAFAILGAATLDGLPSNVPAATGARRGVVLGSITPKP